MAEPFATSDDVAKLLMRDLTDAETTLADAMLLVASAKIRAQFPDIDDRIAAGTLDPVIAPHVAAEMVKRYLEARGPNDALSEQAGPFGKTWAKGESAKLMLTEDDLALLAPSGARAPRTINLGLGIPGP